MKKKPIKGLIVKANELVEARYRLTANEQKIILAMISSIQPKDEDFMVYNFDVKDLAKFMGVKYDAIYNEIDKITNRLLDRRLVISIREKNSTLTAAWISSAEYYHGEGRVELCFDPKLKPYLLKLKDRFVKYEPKVINQMRSGHSIRIYELLKQYEKIGKRIFSIQDIRDMLGIKQDEYKRYYDFKKKVLLIARGNINNNTDIKIAFRELRNGKTVEALEFIIMTNIKTVSEVETPADYMSNLSIEDRMIYNRLVSYYNLSHAQAIEVMAFPREYLIEQLNHIKEDYEKKDIKNKGAYAYKALVEVFQYQKSLFDVEKEEKENKKATEEKETKIAEERFYEELKQKTIRIEESLSDDKRKELLSEFEREMIKSHNIVKWKKFGLKDEIMEALWHRYLRGKFMKPEETVFKEK